MPDIRQLPTSGTIIGPVGPAVSLRRACETQEGRVKRSLALLLTLLLIIGLTKPSAAAFFIDGYELLRNCEGQNENFCVGYIAGTLSATTAYQVLQEKATVLLAQWREVGGTPTNCCRLSKEQLKEFTLGCSSSRGFGHERELSS
jgi:hypothetical protein